MGLFDKVKKQIGNAAETAKKAAENLPDSVKEIDTEKTLKGFQKIGADTIQRAKTEGARLYDKAGSTFKKKKITKLIREQEALEIMYYLIASDMNVAEEEWKDIWQVNELVQQENCCVGQWFILSALLSQI